VRKTVKYTRQPTAEQEGTLALVLRRCCERYHAGLQERREAGRMRGASSTVASQSAQLPASKAVRPDDRALHAQVLHDVLTRLDRAFQACFRRVTTGGQPGDPRLKSSARYDSFTYKPGGNGATLDSGCLVLSKIGRVAVRWSRPLQGTPKTVPSSREAAGGYACFSCAEVPSEPLPMTGCETGIDVSLQVFLVRADGDPVEHPHPRHDRHAERQLSRAQRRVSRRKQGSTRRRTAIALLTRTHQHVQRQRRAVHHTTALALVRAYDVLSRDDLQVHTMVRRPHALPDGNGG
jgi:putative transposase